MAQGVAWMARELGVPATIVVPDNASMAKLAAVERLGGRIVRVTWEKWWAAVDADDERDLGDGVHGFFVHPVQDPPVMAGNGTIGLELVEDLDDFDAVLIPWGGGGLTTGIASALRAVRPEVKVYVCEPESGAPFTAAVANGRVPVKVDYRPSFIDGAGFGLAAPEDVGARTGPRHRCVRGLARGRCGRRAICCSSVRVSSARAQPGCPSRRRWPDSPARAESSASSRAGTSTPQRLAAILDGRVPD